MRKDIIKITGLNIVLLILAIIAINIIVSKIYFRIDITEDKIYSLSKGSKSILKKLNDKILIKYYFTRSSKEVPFMIKNYANRVEELLKEYAKLSKGKIILETYDTQPDSDEEEWANRYGIGGIKLPSGFNMYFGAVFIKGSKEILIPYFDLRREEFLEYDITEAILSTQKTKKNTIGIISSLPILGSMFPFVLQANLPNNQQPWAFIETLQKNFELKKITLDAQKIDENIDLLLIIHPKNISDTLQYAIDQYVMRGGKVIIAVDPYSRFDYILDAGKSKMQSRVPEIFSNLPKLFKAWDIQYQHEYVIGDLNGMIQVNMGGMIVPYPFIFRVMNDMIIKNSVITSQLNEIHYSEGGFFNLKPESPYKLEPLLTTTAESGSLHMVMWHFYDPSDVTKNLNMDGKKKVLAGILRGKFKTAFPEGKPKENTDNKNTQQTTQNMNKATDTHLTECQNDNIIFIIADTDLFWDDNAIIKFKFGQQTIMRPKNDNLALLFNAIDYLLGSEELISIRASGKISRPFIRVQEIQKKAQLKWQAEEERLSQKLAELQKKLQDLEQTKSSGSKLYLSYEQQQEINKFRQEEAVIKKARRKVRKNLREDIEKLGNWLALFNIATLPGLVSIFGILVFIRRTKKMQEGRRIKHEE